MFGVFQLPALATYNALKMQNLSYELHKIKKCTWSDD